MAGAVRPPSPPPSHTPLIHNQIPLIPSPPPSPHHSYTSLCRKKAWAAAAALARDCDDSLRPTATTLPSLTVLQGSPWCPLPPPNPNTSQPLFSIKPSPSLHTRFQARVSQAAQLGLQVPLLLKVFAPAAASPLMQAEAAPVNLMAQCVHVSIETHSSGTTNVVC